MTISKTLASVLSFVVGSAVGACVVFGALIKKQELNDINLHCANVSMLVKKLEYLDSQKYDAMRNLLLIELKGERISLEVYRKINNSDCIIKSINDADRMLK